MESSIGGELALRSLSIDDFSRQLGQGSFRDQHIEFRPTGKTATSIHGKPITQGKVIYYVNGEPVAVYPANSGGFRSSDSLVSGNDTRTPPGHYFGTNFHARTTRQVWFARELGLALISILFSIQIGPCFVCTQMVRRPDRKAAWRFHVARVNSVISRVALMAT